MISPKVRDAVLVTAFSSFVKAWMLLFGIVFWNTPYVQSIVADIRTWFHFWAACAHGAVPYVDITKEYPVGVGLLYWAMTPFMSLANGNGEIILLFHAVLASVMDVVNATILYFILREINARLAFPLAMLFVLLPTALVLSPERFESYVTTTVLLGYWCHRRGHFGTAAFFWSMGCWLKWYPAFFIAAQEIRALVVEKRRWQWLRVTGIFVSVSLGLNLPFIIANLSVHGNIDHWLYAYQFHSGRGVSPDTLLGVAELWFGKLALSDYSGVWTVGLVCVALFVKPSLRIEYRCLLIGLAMLVFNRVYSTQFNLWFYPFLILAAVQETPKRRRWLFGMLLGVDLLNVLVFPVSFVLTLQEVGGFAPLSAASNAGIWTVVFSAAVALRGMMLIALTIFALHDATCTKLNPPTIPDSRFYAGPVEAM